MVKAAGARIFDRMFSPRDYKRENAELYRTSNHDGPV